MKLGNGLSRTLLPPGRAAMRRIDDARKFRQEVTQRKIIAHTPRERITP
jgi:hypothetical protein